MAKPLFAGPQCRGRILQTRYGPKASQEFPGIHGFDDVFVGASGQALDLPGSACRVTGEQNNEHVAQGCVRLDLPAYFDPIQVREPHIQQHEIRQPFARDLERPPAAGRCPHLIPFKAKDFRINPDDLRVVIHQNHTCCFVHPLLGF